MKKARIDKTFTLSDSRKLGYVEFSSPKAIRSYSIFMAGLEKKVETLSEKSYQRKMAGR